MDYCTKLVAAETSFTEENDNLRIKNELAGQTYSNYNCYLATATTRYCCQKLTDFRDKLYARVPNHQFDGIMEYHEKKNQVHAHGYFYTTEDLEPNQQFHLDGLMIHILLPLNIASLNDIARWKSYCTKHCEHTLDRNQENTNGIYARFRKYGKRTKFMID